MEFFSILPKNSSSQSQASPQSQVKHTHRSLTEILTAPALASLFHELAVSIEEAGKLAHCAEQGRISELRIDSARLYQKLIKHSDAPLMRVHELVVTLNIYTTHQKTEIHTPKQRAVLNQLTYETIMLDQLQAEIRSRLEDLFHTLSTQRTVPPFYITKSFTLLGENLAKLRTYLLSLQKKYVAYEKEDIKESQERILQAA